MAAPVNKFIPGDVAEDILARLPVKSLIRFKSVSKPFRALISSRAFTRRLHDESKFLLLCNYKTNAYIIASRPRGDGDPTNAASLVISDFYSPKKKLDSPVRESWVKVVGSGDGLVCIYSQRKGVEVWNPSTRELRVLPDLGITPRFGGICYDPSIGDYKVIVFSDHHNYAVFELKSKRWRRRVKFTNELPATAPMTVNGAIHWLVGSGKPVIYSFDLVKESLTRVLLPDSIRYGFETKLGVLNGFLCVMYKLDGVWTMRGHGSWARARASSGEIKGLMLVGDRFYDFAGGQWRRRTLHACGLRRGEAICVDDKNCGCTVPSICLINTVIPYSVSLVSPRYLN